LLGLGGGAAGTSFQAPQLANVQNFGQQGSITGNANLQSENALTSQQQLLHALQAQGGLGNQSQVYGQLQGLAAGQGPNPALAQLAQTTQQNVANTAALQAGQRGANANVGLLARQAGQQGAATQQQAAGQAATLGAQQQLGAIQAAGNLANQQAAQQINATGALNQAAQGYQQDVNQALAAYNSANIANQGNVNSANAALAGTQMQSQQSLLGGIAGGAGLSSLLSAVPPVEIPAATGAAAPIVSGPSVPGWAEGGKIPAKGKTEADLLAEDPKKRRDLEEVSDTLKTIKSKTQPSTPPGALSNRPDPSLEIETTGMPEASPAPVDGPRSSVGRFLNGLLNEGGNIESPMNSKGRLLKALGGDTNVGSRLKQGGHVPGKPNVGGAVDSYDNDTVDAKLSPGEIVVPRSVTQGKDPVNGAARFVATVLAQKSRGGKR
jgi:hypothetical protein